MMLHALSKPALWLAAVLVFAPLAAEAQQACQAIADGLRSGKSAEVQSPARRLDPRSLATALQSELHATPRLAQEAGKLAEYGKYADLVRLADSDLSIVTNMQGTAGCQFFVFFAPTADGKTDIVDPPPILKDRPEGALMPCSGAGSIARIGTAGGVPAFVVENGADQDETTTVTPWRDHGWQKACTVSVHYDAVFTVTNRYCQGIDCDRTGDFARELALQADKDPAALPPAPFHRELKGPAELPTFGKGPLSPWRFAEDAPSTTVMFDGKQYLARVGHVAIGWRRFPDYLVALYREVGGDDLEPVAGIVIEKKRGPPATITIK